MGIDAAHRLEHMRAFLAYQQLATWRRMNGFNRVVEGEKRCFNGHRSLSPTPQEYYDSLWSEVNALKAVIPMPAERPDDIETGAEDAGYRSGSDAKKGERLLLGT